MEYKPPIIIKPLPIRNEIEGMVMKSVQEVGIHINKGKLVELLAKDKPVKLEYCEDDGCYICPVCKREIVELDAKYCSGCGQRFEEWI